MAKRSLVQKVSFTPHPLHFLLSTLPSSLSSVNFNFTLVFVTMDLVLVLFNVVNTLFTHAREFRSKVKNGDISSTTHLP